MILYTVYKQDYFICLRSRIMNINKTWCRYFMFCSTVMTTFRRTCTNYRELVYTVLYTAAAGYSVYDIIVLYACTLRNVKKRKVVETNFKFRNQ